jgi:hypothetical protein
VLGDVVSSMRQAQPRVEHLHDGRYLEGAHGPARLGVHRREGSRVVHHGAGVHTRPLSAQPEPLLKQNTPQTPLDTP